MRSSFRSLALCAVMLASACVARPAYAAETAAPDSTIGTVTTVTTVAPDSGLALTGPIAAHAMRAITLTPAPDSLPRVGATMAVVRQQVAPALRKHGIDSVVRANRDTVRHSSRAPSGNGGWFALLGSGLIMGTLAADRSTPKRAGQRVNHPVAAAKHIYAGAIVVLNAAGYAEPATTALNKVALGIAQADVDNSAGANGDLSIDVDRGVFRLENSGADAIDRTHIGKTCYLVDDETVAATDGGGTRSAAGTVRDVDAQGVWVEF